MMLFARSIRDVVVVVVVVVPLGFSLSKYISAVFASSSRGFSCFRVRDEIGSAARKTRICCVFGKGGWQTVSDDDDDDDDDDDAR